MNDSAAGQYYAPHSVKGPGVIVHVTPAARLVYTNARHVAAAVTVLKHIAALHTCNFKMAGSPLALDTIQPALVPNRISSFYCCCLASPS